MVGQVVAAETLAEENLPVELQQADSLLREEANAICSQQKKALCVSDFQAMLTPSTERLIADIVPKVIAFWEITRIPYAPAVALDQKLSVKFALQADGQICRMQTYILSGSASSQAKVATWRLHPEDARGQADSDLPVNHSLFQAFGIVLK